jgi:hypothetical protein
MKQITSLETMENVVSKNRSLSWDGWNVIELIKDPKAMFKSSGILVKGIWYIKKIFVVDQDGWRIPSKYVE